jgi:outer membrane protein TolC
LRGTIAVSGFLWSVRMVMNRSMVAMLAAALGIACAGSGVSASYVVAHPGLSHREVLPVASALRPGARPWWSAFQSEALNALIAQAGRAAGVGERADAPAAEIGVSAAYVAVVVQTLRLTYLESALIAVRRQSQLIAASAALHDDFSKELARREVGAAAAMKKIDAQREANLAFLVARCGLPEAALKKTIADEVAQRRLPRFSASLPQAVPAALLANRDDVQLAASLYGIEPQALLVGTIDAARDSGDSGNSSDGDPPAEAALPGYPLFPQAVARGRAEVAEALRRLQASNDMAVDASGRARRAKDEFERSKVRMSRGDMSEVQMLEDFQGLMLDRQRLAAADGELAIAWIALIASLGSQAPVVLRGSFAPDAAALRGRPGLVGSF